MDYGAFETFEALSSLLKDRHTDWHQRFLSKFDFSLPRKLIISIEAATHDNPKEIVQIRQSMMNLYNLLRKYPKPRCLEIVPQSQTYRLSQREDRFISSSTRGSYFLWEIDHRLLPSSQPGCHHKLSRKKPFQLRIDRKPVRGGNLRHLVLDVLPDLALV